jgi:MscS family membrane protein
VPNAALESQKLVNFSRPNSNYYYTIIVPIRADSDPNQAIKIIEEVVLSHPDTLGSIEKKLVAIDNFYRVTDQLLDAEVDLLSKKEAGRKRLMAEQQVKNKLAQIEKGMKDLVDKIKFMEMEGLDTGEIRAIQGYYLDIVKMVGLEIVSEKQRGHRSLSLTESQNMDQDALINLLRNWYRNWQDDPDLIDEDDEVLEMEWERKIGFLKMRMNKFLQQIINANRGLSETKLDDYGEDLWKWIEERFQTYSLWQSPKIWMQDMSMGGGLGTIDMAVKFFVDNVKLEQCQRGNRIRSEVHGEIVRRLRQAYFYFFNEIFFRKNYS